jgi:hypothetical protein
MDEYFEFLVSEVHQHPGYVIVDGICNAGTIPLAAVISSLRKSPRDKELVLSIDGLIVQRIVAYRRDIEELPSGMGGSLQLAGIQASSIEPDDMLIGVAAKA